MPTTRSSPRFLVIAPIVLTLLSTALVSLASAREKPGYDPSDLPAPFRSWNVRVEPLNGNRQVLELTFASPLLHRRVTNRVYLPTGYAERRDPWPVLYYLHGTTPSQSNNRTVDPVVQPAGSLIRRTPTLLITGLFLSGSDAQVDLFHFDREADRARFVVVAPDADKTEPFCHSCMWLDGRGGTAPNAYPLTARAVPADSFLHEELYPLVEALLRVRHDRAGRAVMGLSMGAIDAYQQAMLHPDRYAFAASVSGALDFVDDPAVQGIFHVAGYMRDQGYGTPVTNSADWHGRNPMDLIPNIEDTDLPILSAVGDGCLWPNSLTAADCRAHPGPLNPYAAGVETVLARQYARNAHVLRDRGIQEIRVQYPGAHAGNCAAVYSGSVVPLANSVFARHVEDPAVFHYRSVFRSFSVWGYQVTIDRRRPEFLEITGAHRDGRAFTLRGHGAVRVHTPSSFRAEQTYEVTTSVDGRNFRSSVRADREGRLTIPIDLGRARVADQLVGQLQPTRADPTGSTPVTVRVR